MSSTSANSYIMPSNCKRVSIEPYLDDSEEFFDMNIDQLDNLIDGDDAKFLHDMDFIDCDEEMEECFVSPTHQFAQTTQPLSQSNQHLGLIQEDSERCLSDESSFCSYGEENGPNQFSSATNLLNTGRQHLERIQASYYLPTNLQGDDDVSCMTSNHQENTPYFPAYDSYNCAATTGRQSYANVSDSSSVSSYSTAQDLDSSSRSGTTQCSYVSASTSSSSNGPQQQECTQMKLNEQLNNLVASMKRTEESRKHVITQRSMLTPEQKSVLASAQEQVKKNRLDFVLRSNLLASIL